MAIDEALARFRNELGEPMPCRSGVLVDRLLGWNAAAAATEATVIDREHGKAEVVQLIDARQLSGQVPARPVEIQDRGRVGALRGPPPGMNVVGMRNGNVQLD